MPEPKKVQWLLLVVGYYLLIQSAFFDNIRGPLLPVFSREWEIPYDRLSAFIFAGTIVGLVVTLSFNWLVKKYDDTALAIAALMMALLLTAYVAVVNSYLELVLMAMGIGTLVATFGTLCNLLVIRAVPPAISSRALSGLHAMYGAGSMLASLAGHQWDLSGGAWRELFYLSAVLLLLNLGLLIRVRRSPTHREERTQKKAPLASLEFFQWFGVILFGLYVFAEVGISMWMVSVLVETNGVAVNQASGILFGFFTVLTLTRLAGIWYVRPSNEKSVIAISLGVALLSALLGVWGWSPGWVFAGVLGPFFPVMLGRLTRYSPGNWQLVTVRIIIATQITLTIGHYAIGQVAAAVGLKTAIALPVMGIAIVAVGWFQLEQSLFRQKV